MFNCLNTLFTFSLRMTPSWRRDFNGEVLDIAVFLREGVVDLLKSDISEFKINDTFGFT
jgi:hypothetical protein